MKFEMYNCEIKYVGNGCIEKKYSDKDVKNEVLMIQSHMKLNGCFCENLYCLMQRNCKNRHKSPEKDGYFSCGAGKLLSDTLQILDLVADGALFSLTAMMGFPNFVNQRKGKKGSQIKDQNGRYAFCFGFMMKWIHVLTLL